MVTHQDLLDDITQQLDLLTSLQDIVGGSNVWQARRREGALFVQEVGEEDMGRFYETVRKHGVETDMARNGETIEGWVYHG